MSIPVQFKGLLLAALLAAPAGAAGTGDLDAAIRNGDLAAVQAILAKDPKLLDVQDEAGLTPVILAAAAGRTEVVKELLRLGADLSIGDFENSKAIHSAAQGGFADTVELLVDAGQDVNARDDNAMTPLHFAASEGRYALVVRLLERGADVNAKNKNGWGPLHCAVARNHAHVVDCLLENGADARARAEGGFTPLHSAASFGNLAVVQALLDHGAEVQARDDNGGAPLHWALNANTCEVAALLIEKGADATLRDARGRTPLHGVAQRGSVNVARLLLERGADIDAVDESGVFPLAIAASGKLEMVQFLLEQGARVAPAGKDAPPGRTPLHFAVWGGNVDTVRLLLDQGVDVDAADPDGETALRMAVREWATPIVECLLGSGASIDARDPGLGRTDLHLAAASGQIEVARLLLDQGADPAPTDVLGQTPLALAREHGFASVASLLQGGGAAAEIGAQPEVATCAAVLAQCTQQGDACIAFLGHSGWAIKTAKHFLIFDYFLRPDLPDPPEASLVNGRIVPAELKGEDVYAFASHEHGDHFNQGIFSWRETLPRLHYVLGLRPRPAPCAYTFVPPRSEQTIGDVKVTAIASNDAGVGFLVEVDGLVILHAGDHANRSVEPGAARDAYRREIDFLAERGVPIDLAFFPVSGCGFGLPENVAAGVQYAAEKLRPKVICPMHAGEASQRLRLFADRYGASLGGAKVSAAIDRGDRFVYRREQGEG